jgi:hypothetical protein
MDESGDKLYSLALKFPGRFTQGTRGANSAQNVLVNLRVSRRVFQFTVVNFTIRVDEKTASRINAHPFRGTNPSFAYPSLNRLRVP